MSKFDTLYLDVKRFYEDSLNGQLTPASITTITRYTMELVNSQNLKGSEKKALVLEIVNEIVKDALSTSDISDEAKQVILTAVSFTPLLIDAAVDFAKIYSSEDGGCKKACKGLRCCMM